MLIYRVINFTVPRNLTWTLLQSKSLGFLEFPPHACLILTLPLLAPTCSHINLNKNNFHTDPKDIYDIEAKPGHISVLENG